MGFRAITSAFQAQINEHQDRTVSAAMVEDVEDILEDYCATLEAFYGISLSFDVEVAEDTGRLKYSVLPDSDFDGELLMHITENECQVARVSTRIQ